MSKRKSTSTALVTDTKKMKSKVETRRSTRTSRSKAEELIKQQIDESSDEDSSSDDFVLPTQASTNGSVVKSVNSFLSDSSSSEDESPAIKKKPQTAKKRSRSSSDESSDGESSSAYFDNSIPSTSKSGINNFDSIEKNILVGVTRLSDSEESDMEDVKPAEVFVPTHVLFPQLVKNETTNDDIKSQGKTKKESSGKGNSRKKVEVKIEKSDDTVGLDISDLLALGESQTDSKENTKSSPKSVKKEKSVSPTKPTSKRSIKKETKETESKKKVSSSKKVEPPVKKSKGREVLSESDDGSDWEEVEHNDQEMKQSVIPSEGVEITVQLPDIVRRKKKKGVDMETIIKRRINQVKRDNQVLIHKVSLLCWLGHGMYINNKLNSPALMGCALSLIPSQHCYPPRQVDLAYLEKINKWFRKTVALMNREDPDDKTIEEILEDCFQNKKAYNKRILALLFVCMMRSLGVKTRLIISLQPLPLKPKSDELLSITDNKNSKDKPSTSGVKVDKESDKKKSETNSKSGELNSIKESKNSKNKASSSSVKVEKDSNKKKSDTKSSKSAENKKLDSPQKKSTDDKHSKSRTSKDTGKTSKYFSEKSSIDSKNTHKNSPKNETSSRKSISEKIASKKPEMTSSNRSRSKSDGKSSASQSVSKKPEGHTLQNLRGRKSSKYKDTSSEESEDEKKKSHSRRSSSRAKVKVHKKSESDTSDFEPEVVSVKKKVVDRRVLSSEEETIKEQKPKKSKEGVNFWAEVFVEMEEKWICVDVPNSKVHCVKELYVQASQPVSYVMAFGMDMSVRDVTQRYCPQFHSTTRKLRVESEWWDSAVKPFYGRRTAYDKEEEEELNKQLQDRPLPTSIGEYKNHPLYVLQRHLLKFEALYPPEAATMGFIRGEPVYSRDCVFTLRSRETWLKEAKVVRLKEEPYKIVKSRPKYDRMTGQMVTDKPLEIFGPWQVEDYVPPAAVDGKVPRNEYGNVELFKPTMLPKGTVHLQVPNLNRVAKKLNVDCAPAMVGFDYHCGGCHPVFEGFVVCEEFKDILLDACRQEEEERERRHEEKRLKRVYGNWRRLINGLLIRENLKRKYSFGKEEQGEGSSKSTDKRKPTSKKTTPASKSKPPSKVQRKHSRESSSESDSD